MKICVIDIGTNSVHAIFAEIRAAGVFHVIGRDKEMVRLGDGALMTGRLSAKAMNAAMVALKRFLHLAKHRGVMRVIATATSAVREAKNGGAFIERVRRETGLKTQLLAGREEGRLVWLAVKNALDLDGKKTLIIDIGGGSMECVMATPSGLAWIESVKAGVNRLRQTFTLSDPPRRAELKKLEKGVDRLIAPAMSRLDSEGADFLVGTSGTWQSLQKLTSGLKQKTPDTALVGVSVGDAQKIYKQLAALKIADRVKLKGVDKARADMIVHGACLVWRLLRHVKPTRAVVCDKALREGVLHDYIEKNRKSLKIEEDIPDIRRRSVAALAAFAERLRAHCEQTARLAVALFDELKNLHRMEARDRELLEFAALLHDIGYHIGFHKHHRHAQYLIENAALDGFSPDEITTLAWTARLHRRGAPKKEAGFLALPPAIRKRTLRLAALLRIADALDQSHFSVVRALSVKISGKTVRVRVDASQDARWETYEADQRKELFEKVFKKKLFFKIRTDNHE